MVWNWSRWLSEHGYFGSLLGSGGNVSIFDRQSKTMIITPSGRPYRELEPEDVCVIDTQSNRVQGKWPPSMESGMHLEIYRCRPDVDAVVHTHQIYASMMSLIDRSIPPLFDEVVYEIGPTVEIIPYAVSGSPELARQVGAILDNGCFCYIIQNHGALSLGQNLHQAVKRAEILEKTANAYYLALTTGQPITTLSDSAVKHMLNLRKKNQA